MAERGGPIDAERWRQIKELFQQAVELPEQERRAFIERLCRGDEDLEAEVLSLLESDLEGTEFLELPPPSSKKPQSARPRADEAIDTGGRYRIVRKVGEGGMGEVYEAEQLEPVRRRVALKVIKRGMDSRQVIARFETERQALAVMSHRSIARVFDAGSTVQGRPYFAMEYVDGLSITEYCDRHRLTPRERLELFREVCIAVQHAHQKGVIHRDLKPSNLLVKVEGGRALPKVIDFGVSKAISQRLVEQSLFTQAGQWVGTPEYMSPEQADLGGIDVDTRTDVYSLGVVLYELLVGARPFDPETLRRAGFDEVRRVIREDDPPRPSTRVTSLGDDSTAAAEARRLDPPTLRRTLRGDLDAIVMKALEKDRARRYGSPSELSADLDRHLRDEPVLATPPSAWYRARKFVRRHRFGAAAGLLLGVSLLGGITATLWQARRAHEARERAERRFNDVRNLANSFIFEIYDAIEELPGATPVRKLVVERALEYLDDLVLESGGEPELLRELAAAYVRVGDVQGAPFHANLGDFTGASASYAKAIEILEPLRATPGGDQEILVELSDAHIRLGRMSLTDGQVETAREHFQKARDLLSNAPRLESGLLADLTLANEGVGVIFEEQGDLRSARAIYAENLELERAQLERTPNDLHARRSLAIAHGRFAQVLEAQLDWRGAAEHQRKSIALLESVRTEDPWQGGARRELAVDKRSLAEVLGALGSWSEAARWLDESEAEVRELMEDDATDQVLIGDLGVLHDARGYLAARRGDFETAITHYERAFEIAETFVPEVLQSLEVQVYLMKIHLHYGEALAELGRTDQALGRFRRAVQVGEVALRNDAVRRLGYSDLAVAHARVGSALLVGAPDPAACAEATEALDESRAIRASLTGYGSPTGWPDEAGFARLERFAAECRESAP